MVNTEVRFGNKVKNVELKPTVEKCEGCKHVTERNGEKVCDVYPNPEFMWREVDCLGATHVERKIVSAAEAKVNPLKASKRASRGR